MNKVKQEFENIWKIKIMGNKFRKGNKKRYYEFFMDGYGCALIDIKDSPNTVKEKLEWMAMHGD